MRTMKSRVVHDPRIRGRSTHLNFGGDAESDSKNLTPKFLEKRG